MFLYTFAFILIFEFPVAFVSLSWMGSMKQTFSMIKSNTVLQTHRNTSNNSCFRPCISLCSLDYSLRFFIQYFSTTNLFFKLVTWWIISMCTNEYNHVSHKMQEHCVFLPQVNHCNFSTVAGKSAFVKGALTSLVVKSGN